MLSRLSINVPSINQRVRRLSGGQRQAISICRAVGSGAKLVVMDELTAALGVQETANVEALIRRLREQSVSVILVSHWPAARVSLRIEFGRSSLWHHFESVLSVLEKSRSRSICLFWPTRATAGQ